MLDQIKSSLKDCLSSIDPSIDISADEIEVSILFDEKGDFTTNIALKFSKIYKQKPSDLAKIIIDSFSSQDFEKIDIRLGTVISVEKNEKARKPSLVLKVDFGAKIGVKQSSAQITHFYNKENLVGKQVIGVCNFPEKNIAGVVSQVLILGSIDPEGKVTLVHPSQKADNGLPIA